MEVSHLARPGLLQYPVGPSQYRTDKLPKEGPQRAFTKKPGARDMSLTGTDSKTSTSSRLKGDLNASSVLCNGLVPDIGLVFNKNMSTRSQNVLVPCNIRAKSEGVKTKLHELI